MGILYKNKYRKQFIDSSQSYDITSHKTYEHASIQPFENQDPTYMGFRIRFIFDEIADLNNYDTLPNSLMMKKDDEYSAYKYLININEPERAEYLLKFIDILKSLQYDTPWYFQSLNGLDTLQKIDPEKGARTAAEAGVTIEMLESIDQRIALMIQLYRKAAWDSIYHRWMLPENMRWFKVEFTIAEIREFHATQAHLEKMVANTPETGSNINGGILEQGLMQSAVAGRVNNLINKGKDAVERVKGIINNDEPTKNFSDNFLIRGVNETLPMHVILCEMCEFDFINRNDPWASSISVADSGEAIKQEIKIKVGKVIEASYFSLSNLLLRDDNVRNRSEAAASILKDDILARLGDEDISSTRNHKPSGTNWLKDRVKSIATGIVSETVDRFVEGVFMGEAFDGKKLNDNFKGKLNADRAAMIKKIEFDITNSSSVIAANVELNEPNVVTEVPSEDMIPDVTVNTNVTQQNIGFDASAQQPMQPTNVGFILPQMNIEILGNIGF